MSLNRYAKRRDQTESPIVAGLRQLGYQVRHQDVPDLLVRDPRTDRVFLLEVEGVTKHRKRGLAQLGFIRAWRVPVVKTLDEALVAVGARVT